MSVREEESAAVKHTRGKILLSCIRMISHLRGIVGKPAPGLVTVDVQGVGYKVMVPMNDWDNLLDAALTLLHTSAYVREDRFDLYGFLDPRTRTLFEELIGLTGVGPRMGLELCAVPRGLLVTAVNAKNSQLLTTIKGIGRKTAEKLLLELASLAEREPQIFIGEDASALGARYDQDTVAALTQLGFETQDILKVLESLPSDISSTEERVTAALRAL